MIYVLFKDGTHGWYVKYDIGMAFIGEPTKYIYRQVGAATKRVYVRLKTPKFLEQPAVWEEVEWTEEKQTYASNWQKRGVK